MSETISFPSVRARRLPTPGLKGDVLADISQPAAIEATAMQTMVAAFELSLRAFGIAKTIDMCTQALKEARSKTGE